MGNIGLPGILLIALIILLLFGRNRFSNMMGDLAKGVKNFKKGMADEEAERPVEPRQLPREDTVDVEARRDQTRDETRQAATELAGLLGLLCGTGHALLPFFLQCLDLLWIERWWRNRQRAVLFRVIVPVLRLGLVSLRQAGPGLLLAPVLGG